MAILLVILLITLGLAFRAAAVGHRVSLAGSDRGDDIGLVDAFARTSLLVFLSSPSGSRTATCWVRVPDPRRRRCPMTRSEG
ncbi:MAG: hypothetical protein E6J40_04915 [Chloroflexi bacterium]|nr:MAG: hypothetical protein E6J40_04915 [Chloroflexota bacterium]